MEQNLKDKYYVRLLTEKDREEVERLDEEFNTDVAYQLDHTDHTSRGYGLFQHGEYGFEPDKLIAQCSIERDLEDFSEDDKDNSLSNMQKQFATYDLHRAFQFFEINEIQDDTDNQLLEFFLQEIVTKQTRPVFIRDYYVQQDILERIGFQMVSPTKPSSSAIFLYLPKKATPEIDLSNNRTETLHNSMSNICKFCKEIEYEQTNWKCCSHCRIKHLFKDLERISNQDFSLE